MWGQTPNEVMFRRAADQDQKYSFNLHNTDQSAFQHSEHDAHRSDSENPSDQPAELNGTWGERDVGGPVSMSEAMQDYERLQRELSKVSRTVSRDTQATGPATSLSRGATGGSAAHRLQPYSTRRSSTATGAADEETDEDNDFDVGGFLRDGHLERRTAQGGAAKKVGVTYKHLTVKGVGAQMAFPKTLPEAVINTFGPDLYHLICRFIPALKFGKPPPTRDLIRDFSGTVRDGEMMLVLGRPGSGCSTFLKVIANQRETYAAVEGEVKYGDISAEEQKKLFNGEVNYNPEDDQHFPDLNVWQTLRFALMNKTRKHDKASIPVIINALLKIFGITHTQYTKVGNEYVRGVSGGERKRVGIAETLATKSTVVCWDNSTRGLDASTALDYAKSLRVMTDISNRTTIVTLYQAGEGIYELMDKVLVIEEGRMIYQGPADKAKQYFVNLGFHCPDRQTTADFLTSVGDPNERQFQSGKEKSTPKTPEELEAAFRKSELFQEAFADVNAYERKLSDPANNNMEQFRQAVDDAKSNSKLHPKRSSYTVPFIQQVLACTQREFWLFWGDKSSLYTKAFIIVANALIVGSLFYGQSEDSVGAFSRGGVLFFSVLFLGWLQLGELMKAVSGRVVVARHKDYAFYRPSAVAVARVLLDIPVLAVQAMVFGLIVFFMSGLTVDAGKFFIYLLFIYITTICVTALYRMFAALSPTMDDAVRFSGTGLNIMIVFVGYVIPKQTLVNKYIWFGWLNYVNPISYAFEAVVSNEFAGRILNCSPEQLVPPGGQAGFQSCSLSGTPPGQTIVPGSDYLSQSFSYSRSNLWRNFGVVIAFTFLYIFVTVFATEIFSFAQGGGGALLFKKTKKAKQVIQQESKPVDEEKTATPESSSSSGTLASKDDIAQEIAQSSSVFTWEDLEYEVPYQGSTRKLLNKVTGYVKPGVMIALMGASGAGKTTLLNTLSQRQTVGVVRGDMLVDGRALGQEFQRGTGFCEQMDLHEATATIREALEFSAVLRQDRTVSRADKIAYVDKIIDLLELQDIQDAIIGSLGVEQRKRLTIGVELAAKPSLLLFLDEPTSGLDSQSAFSIARFLKKLSHAGQAIICTIHQPSSMLIQQFDMILALNPGGNQFYFGPVGDNGSAVIKYFADRGTQCPPGKNVAEFILETAIKGGSRGSDGKRVNWNRAWLESQEFAEVKTEIKRLQEERSKLPLQTDKQLYTFAAPVTVQTWEVTKRTFVAYWRDPSYLYGKLFVSVIIGIFNGFTFYMLDNSVGSLQLRLFSAFLILLIPPTIVNGVVPKFYQNRSLWETREHPSRIYNWFAFCTAQVVAEIPMAIVGSVLYFLLWYYPAGFPRDSSTAGYVFLMSMLFYLFQSSWGQWICAFAPSFTVISNVLPFFFVMVALFNGIVRPYPQIPTFWRYWMYYVNPSTWWIAGVLAAVIGDMPITCAAGETTIFSVPPSFANCGDYANPLIVQGSLLNPSATSDCEYCPYSNGNEYLRMLNIEPGDRWRNFGIFLAFTITNWLLVYFFIYFVRVRKFSFGLGFVFGSAEKGISQVTKLFGNGSKEEGEQSKSKATDENESSAV